MPPEIPEVGSACATSPRMQDALEEKIRLQQRGVPTFFDNLLRTMLRHLEQGPAGEAPPAQPSAEQRLLELVRRYSAFATRQRFVTIADRLAESENWKRFPWELTTAQFQATQGVEHCVRWQGLPLFKSVFDLALYPMLLWDVRPATVIELGSGAGASALWFADVMHGFDIDGDIYSVDLRKPDVHAARVTFLQGDCRTIETIITDDLLGRAPHPWIIIEDVHVNTLGLLRYFAAHLSPGDYLIVEDALVKQDDLKVFAREASRQVMVDTRYTDFFGRNMTCSADAIFARLDT
jgi:cephalosporin hydroxylase